VIPPFIATRTVIDQLDGWIAAFAGKHEFRRDADGDWKFVNETPEALQLGKAVRAVTSLRAALILADNGYTTEAGSQLRIASDIAHEIIAIGEGLLEGRLTTNQRRFVEQYFAPMARSPEELEQRGKEFYVSREELFAAHQRLADKTTKQGELLRSLSRFLNYGYDKYVHGSYGSAMELFRGDEGRFMLRGHDSERHRCATLTAIASKLFELLAALGFMTFPQRDEALFREIREAVNLLETSGEQSGEACRHLT
jgi:hypothetical protein